MNSKLKTALIIIAALVGFVLIVRISAVSEETLEERREKARAARDSVEATTKQERWWKIANNAYIEGDFPLTMTTLKYLKNDSFSSVLKDSAAIMYSRIEPEWRADSIRIEKELVQKKARYKSMFRKKVDEFEGTTFYQHKSSPYYTDQTGLKFYIGKEGTSVWPRFRIQYADDDWLFMSEWVFKADDETYTIRADYYDVERDNGSGGIWEWYDYSPPVIDIDFLKRFAKAKVSKIRYKGSQYYDDVVIYKGQKQALLESIQAYEDFKKHPDLAP